MFLEIKNWHILESDTKSFIGYDYITGKKTAFALDKNLY